MNPDRLRSSPKGLVSGNGAAPARFHLPDQGAAISGTGFAKEEIG